MTLTSLKRMTGLTLVLLVLLFATNGLNFYHLFVQASAESAYHQVKLSPDDVEHTTERRRKIAGLHEPRPKDTNEKSRQFSHSKSINIEVEDDDEDEDDAVIQRKARERLMRASAEKKQKLHKLIGKTADGQQQQHISVGIAEAFDHEAEVHGDLFDNDNLVDPITGYGAHRRRIIHEGDTDENRRKVKGIAKHLDAKFARSGDGTPTAHDGVLPDNHFGHSKNDEAIGHGPLGQRATRKIREYLIAKGLIDPSDPNAKLHIPHDLHLTEEDYYHDEDLEFEEVEVEVDVDENGNRIFNNGGAEDETAITGDAGASSGTAAKSKSKSLSPSISRKTLKKEKKISSKSRSHSYSHRRPLAGAKSRPITKQVSKGLRSVSSANIPNGANFVKPSEQDIKESIVVADLNAHEKEKFDFDDDDDDKNNAINNNKNIGGDSARRASASRSFSFATSSFDLGSSSALNGVRYDTDDEFEAARGPSVIDAEKERNAIFSSRRERMKAILREKKMFYAVQQPKKTADYVSPQDWEYFVCQVCNGIAEEYSRGLTDDTASAFHVRLTEQAENNVTDLYTWKSGSHDAARRDYQSAATSEEEDVYEDEEEEDTEEERRRRLLRSSSSTSSVGGGKAASKHEVLKSLHRGIFARTRSDNRYEHAPHTKEEGAIRKIISALIHRFLLTAYEKEIFFRAIQTIAATTRPVSVPSIFIREELCAIRKEVCPRTPQLYEGGKFAHLLNNLNFAIATYEREGAEQFEFIKHVQEERELKQEIELEDEEDRVALLEEELQRQGRLADGKRPFSKSLGIGDVDENGNRVIVEGKNTIGLQRKSKRISLAIDKDPEAQELSRKLIEEATMRIAMEDAEREEKERLRRLHTPSESHEL